MAGRETKLKSGKPKLRSRNRSQGVARLLWTGGGVGGGVGVGGGAVAATVHHVHLKAR